MLFKEDKFYYFILVNLLFFFTINPYVSPYVLKSNDLQLPVFFIAIIIFVLDLFKNQIKINAIHIIILLFWTISIFYFLPNSFSFFLIAKKINILLGFFIFYVFYRYSFYINIKIFYFAVFFNLFGVFSHYFFTDFFIYFAEFFVRVIKIKEFTGRGASGFSSEPLYAASLLFFICILSKYFFNIKKIDKNIYILIQTLSLICIFLTKSGTGYVYFLFLVIFVYFSFHNYYSLIFKILTLFITVFLISSLDQYIQIDNRGYYVLRDLFASSRDFFCDESILTRIHSILHGFSSTIENPFGKGTGSLSFIEPSSIEKNYFITENYILITENDKINLVTRYFNYCSLENNPGLIKSNIFMSNIGMYMYEYGLLFVLFLILLFVVDLKFTYINFMFIISCTFMLQSSLSFAFPAFWLLIAFTKKQARILNE